MTCGSQCSHRGVRAPTQMMARGGRPSMADHRGPSTARPLGAAALPSLVLDGGRDARICENMCRDALRLSGRPRAAHAMGREAASESHGRGRLSGTQQPKDARMRQGRRPGGQTHTSVVSSVAGLPLNSDLASVDSKFTSLLQLLVGPATRPERAHPERHERLRANGGFAAISGAGRWWYGVYEGVAACG
jgi:hypothetical protein